MKNKILPLIAIFGLVFAIFVVFKLKPDNSTLKPPREPASINKEQGKFEQEKIVVALGLIEPKGEEIAIATYVGGVVEEVFVETGDDIKKGDDLFLIDSRRARAQIDVANSQLEVAKAKLKTAQSKLDFYKKIDNEEAVAKEEMENRENELLQAQANLEEAKARIQQAQIEFDLHLVKSPIDGKVLKVNIRKGELVSANSVNEKYMIIADLSSYNVRTQIDEYSIADLGKNISATVIVKGARKEEIKASLLRIEPYVEAKRNLSGAAKELVDTRILDIIFRIDENRQDIFVGQQVDVYIKNNDKNDGIINLKKN